MMLTKCYCVVYHVADFSADGEFICHQDAYRDYNNALLVARDLAKYFDIADDVYVIDGLTGEVLNTILKDEPQEDTAEKNDAPASSDTFDDGTGGVWQCRDDGKWGYHCRGLTCPDCAYYDEGRCLANGHVAQEQRDILIESAKAKMKK